MTESAWLGGILGQAYSRGVALELGKGVDFRGALSAARNPETGLVEVTASSGGAEWQTLLDVDLTAESNQTLDEDTTYTVGGVDWTKKNSANDAVAAKLQNGVGLVLCPDADFGQLVAGEAPKLVIGLDALLADSTQLAADTPIRAMIRCSANVSEAETPSCISVALEYDTAGYAGVHGTRYYNMDAPYGGQAFASHDATVEELLGDINILPTYDCPAIWMPHGISGMSLRYGRGLWSGGWPEIPWFAGWSPTNERWQDEAWPGVGIPRNWQLALSAGTVASDEGSEWIIQNVRVDVKL